MKDLQIFKSNEFGEVRVVEKNGEPWFVGKDVADILGYKNGSRDINRHVDEEDREKEMIAQYQNGTLVKTETTIISESGLYSLILSSKLPKAKKFKRWVTSEVLPSIRKQGAYMTAEVTEKVLADPDFLIKLAISLKEERAKRELVEAENAKNKPKVVFAQSCEVAENNILIGELAKRLKQNGVNIGQNRLFEWLRQRGYLCKSGSRYNLPTQHSINLGLFEVKTRTVNNADGTVRMTYTPMITGKGQIYFTNKFL